MSRTSLVRAQGVRDGTEQRVTENYAATFAQNLYDKEKSERQAADDTLQDNIDAEASARAAADNRLQNNIDTEVGERQGADSELWTALEEHIENPLPVVDYIDRDNPPALPQMLFVLKNNTGVDFDYIPTGGDPVYKFSESVPSGESRICTVIKVPVSGAEYSDGYVYVLNDEGVKILLTALSGRITTAQNAIDVLNGGDTVSGSVGNQIWNKIGKKLFIYSFGYLGLKIYTLPVASTFVIVNANEDGAIGSIPYNDEVGYTLSTPIPKGSIAVCQLMSHCNPDMDNLTNGTIDVWAVTASTSQLPTSAQIAALTWD